MKKLLLVAAMLFIGLFAQAQITIHNNSSCAFSLVALYSGGGGVSYPVAPSGTTIIPGLFVGVEVATSPNSIGQPDGGLFVDPSSSSTGSITTNPWYGFPSSGTFYVVGCGYVNVIVSGAAPGPITVDIN